MLVRLAETIFCEFSRKGERERTLLRRGYGVPSKLSDADKFDLQQYITRCYGSLTTFNILFKNKDDQFRTSAVDGPNPESAGSERIN